MKNYKMRITRSIAEHRKWQKHWEDRYASIKDSVYAPSPYTEDCKQQARINNHIAETLENLLK
jgi:hypothetical protein